MKPGVKNDGREQVDEENILAEDKDARIHPFGADQNDTTSDEPQDKRGGGLIDPAVPLEQVAEDNAAAEQRDEDVDGDDGVVVRHRQPGVLESEGSQIEPHAGRHLGGSRSPPASGSLGRTRDSAA